MFKLYILCAPRRLEKGKRNIFIERIIYKCVSHI